MTKIYDFKALTSKGKELDFSEFQGKVLLIVNTASKCDSHRSLQDWRN